jgi:hypothetical protein
MKVRVLLLAMSLAALARGENYIGQGYYQAMPGPDTVPKYVKIQGDSGFYCILDGKSSFRFKIIGDSMTTPMNGMDRISYSPGSGSLEMSGEEKGEPYFTIFAPRSASQYPAACVEEEEELYGQGTTGLLRSAPVKGIAGTERRIDVLGRKLGATARSVRVVVHAGSAN